MPKKLLNIAALGEDIGQSERTIRTWVHGRKIPFMRIGHRTLLFDTDKVRAALEKFEVKEVG